MTQEEFSNNCRTVSQLEFLDNVSVSDTATVVFVELSPRLASLLPANLSYLWFNHDSLSVISVMVRYELLLQNLQKHGFNEAYALGSELLQIARIQTSKI